MNLSESWASFPWVPDRRPVWDWARDNITLPNALARRGRFDLSGSRHFMEPFQWLKDERVREVNIRAPVRSGKTLLADLWMPWTRANDPGSVLWVFQDEAIAKSHAEMRAMPALKSVAAIRDILPTGIARHKQRTNNVLFPDGLLITLIGPAVGGLQSRGFRYPRMAGPVRGLRSLPRASVVWLPPGRFAMGNLLRVREEQPRLLQRAASHRDAAL